MGIISRLFNFTPGTAIDSEQVDAELNQILALLNGGLDLANVATVLKNTFPKLAVAADRKENFGVAVVTLAGGTGALTVAHGLGVSPVSVTVTPRGYNFMGGYDNPGSTNVDLLVTDRLGAYSGPVTVSWRAIG